MSSLCILANDQQAPANLENAWVHHPLSTEKYKTELQLWISGLHFTQFGQRILQNAQDPVTEVCTYLLKPPAILMFFMMLAHVWVKVIL